MSKIRTPRYIPGDWLVKCDRCGFTRYASQCKTTWDNLLVCSDTCWEPRQPQDFVRGRIDRTRVPIARPDSQVTQRTTTLGAAASKHATSLTVASTSGMRKYSGVGIKYAEGLVHWTVIDTATGTTLTIVDPMIETATNGQTVYIADGDNFITATQQTATML